MSTPGDPYEQSPEQPAPRPVAQGGYPGQPAASYYYGPPPPQPANRGVWFAIGAGSMLGLGLIAAFGMFFLLPFIFFAGDPHFDDFDEGFDEYAYYVDQRSVLDAVTEPCAEMREAGTEIKLFGDPDDVATRIEAFSVTAQDIADAIGGANPNDDSQQWQADWETLSEDLAAYATNLAEVGENATFTSLQPFGDRPLMVRMEFSSDADCEVPLVVYAMDPQNAGFYSFAR